MPTATKSKPKAAPIAAPPTVDEMTAFLVEEFPAEELDKVKVCHTWDNYFRVNYYSGTKRTDSTMVSYTITNSWFVAVEQEKGKLTKRVIE